MKPDLQAGTDYVVKDCAPSDADWYPLSDNTYTSEYRHSWVFVRNRRPKDPTFLHCPMPRRGDGEQDRNVAVIMIISVHRLSMLSPILEMFPPLEDEYLLRFMARAEDTMT